MWFFKSRTKLTSTEREAIARLRERRATGDVPAVLTHAVPHTPVGPPPTFGAAFLLRGRGNADKESKRREKERVKAERARTRAYAAGGEDSESSALFCGLASLFARLRRGGSDGQVQVRHSVPEGGGVGLREKLVNVGSRLKEVVSGNMDNGEDEDLVKPNISTAEKVKRKTMRMLSRRKESPKMENGGADNVAEVVDHENAYFQNLMIRA